MLREQVWGEWNILKPKIFAINQNNQTKLTRIYGTLISDAGIATEGEVNFEEVLEEAKRARESKKRAFTNQERELFELVVDELFAFLAPITKDDIANIKIDKLKSYFEKLYKTHREINQKRREVFGERDFSGEEMSVAAYLDLLCSSYWNVTEKFTKFVKVLERSNR